MKHLASLALLLLCVLGVSAQVQIVASDTVGCAPIRVDFSLTGNLPPNVTGYSWSANGTAFSSQASPSRIFTTAGTFNISVRLLFTGAPPQTVQMTVPVQTFLGPTADFSAQPLVLCKTAPVTFRDNSTPGSSPVVSWVWSFGDGTTSNAPSPVKRYSQGGSYGVSVQAIDANGCSGTEFKPQYVTVNWPDATFVGSPTTACNPPLFPGFSAVNTGPGFSHQWNFGNAQTGTGPVATGIYNFNGTYSVTHIITDPTGCTDTLVRRNMINIGNNRANIIASDTAMCPGDTIFLDCNSVTALQVQWNIPGPLARSCSNFFTANTPGRYLITLENTEPGPCTVRDTIELIVRQPPQLAFTAAPVFSCDPPLNVQFTNTSTGTGVNYTWLLGDGSTSTLFSPSNIYTRKSIYTIDLIGVDQFGCSSTLSQLELIRVGGISAGFLQDTNSGCKPVDVMFFDGSTPGPGGPAITHFWDLGDGTTSNIPNPINTYPDTGDYRIKLIVTDSLGCIDSAFSNVLVGDTVTANFDISDSIACVRQEVLFTNTSTGNYNRQIWDFGTLVGGSVSRSNLKDPIYAFQDTGYYYVELIVSDRGCADTLRIDSAVYAVPPKAAFEGNFVGCDTPHTVFFQDSSIGATRYFWDFGTGLPGDTSNIPGPIFTYRQTGFYTVTQIVWNNLTGCSDTAYETVSVEVFRMSVSAAPLSGCAPLQVQFTDQSIGGAIWNWSFGDGNRSIQQNPLHTYQNQGPFFASIVLYSAGACSDARSITINPYRPNIFFTAQDTNACIGDTIRFQDATASPINLVNWQWDFGDGNSSTDQDPKHVYARSGDFTVTLTVTDSRGCVNTFSRRRFILVSKPNASYSPVFPATCIGRRMVFTDRSSGISSLIYNWAFGDLGGSFTPGSQVYTYTRNDTFTTQLIVTDSLGCRDTLQVPVIVDDPRIQVAASQTFINCPPLLVNFTATIQSAHNFVNWNWNFGDGNGSNVQNPTHQYTLPGSYQVYLVATSSSGCSDTFFLNSTITVLGPSGSFSFTPLSGCQDLTISGTTQLTNTVSNGIDFNDGTVLTGSPLLNTFSHVYTLPGVYYPVMILDDGQGCRLSVVSPDSVEVYPKPVADFRPSQAALCDTGTLQFLDRTTSTTPLTNWLWDFGDNTTSTIQNPPHFYNGPGSYTVQLIVTTVDGCKDTATAPAAITVHPLPQAGIRLSGIAGCTPFFVEAFDASPGGTAPIVDWEWDFGVPGATDRQQNASFTYLNPGSYAIRLTITDANGCVSTVDTTIEAWPKPQADFVTRGDSFGCAPFPVTFLDRSTGPVPMTAWKWRFGTGDSSVTRNPQYVYDQDGQYGVWLAVTDSRGCSDTLLKPEYINLSHPVADFSIDTDLGCPPLSVTFTDQSSSDTTLIAWNWDFGDGNSGNGTPVSHAYLSSGLFGVGLIVEDVFGCKDTVEKPELITVLIDRAPVPPPIRYVTVESDNDIYIEWNRYTDTARDFGAYRLEQNTGAGWVEIFRSEQLIDTTFIASSLQTRFDDHCYRLLVENHCKRPSNTQLSIPHCVVRLTAVPSTDAIQLDWTAYKGWPGVKRYRVYRVGGYNSPNRRLIATLPADSLSFIDTDMFCYREFTYRIEAEADHDNIFSWSNIDEEIPNHFPLGDSLHIVRATVVDDDYVQVEWERPFVRQGNRVILERNTGQVWERMWLQTYNEPNTIFEDRRVPVDQAIYRYRGFVIDSCGDPLPIGRNGRNILLKGDRKGGTNYLSWSPYDRWKEGVKRYEILVFNEDLQRNEIVGTTDGLTTYFEDRTTELVQVRYCYTIRAIEESGGFDTLALSNEVCLYIDPIFYAPTAFSPNGDGHNETFTVPASSVGSYHLQIFNRWGNLIFESRTPNQGWDGTYKGTAVPEGVYVWTVYATGLTGRPIIEQTGSVTLIR